MDKMTVKEVLKRSELVKGLSKKHASDLGLTVNGKTTYLDEKSITIIKARIERSGRTDLAHGASFQIQTLK